MNDYSEDNLIEKPTIALFSQMGWPTVNAYSETYGPDGTLGRDNRGEVVLVRYLTAALKKINGLELSGEVISSVIEQLTADRSRMDMAAANREIYLLIKEGVKVNIRQDDGSEQVETVRLLDFDNPENNDFLLVSQFWMTGELYTRRADLVAFVNGIPLGFIELKASHKNIERAYKDNLTDYRDTVPALFWYNGFIILSNGSASRLGSMTSSLEHFSDWKRIEREDEPPHLSLETMIRGVCDKRRMLDIIENFTIFQRTDKGLIKMVARNHQYLGVNQAIAALQSIRNKGQSDSRGLGVFWHTQGSGKSLSMIFYAQKVLRKLPGNWTFVMLTDRKELDDQLYKNFVDCHILGGREVHAQSCRHLRELLGDDHRYIFSLIHKFRPEEGWDGQPVNDRDDIIVIADEAHRSQYDTLAQNMRLALPNAAFLAFTGTPLLAGEERTREVFGDYVSVYDYKQSADDKATVPLYYENRIPELQLTNQDLDEELADIVEQADLDEDQILKLEKEFARQYHLITRDSRLETIAEDLVRHFTGRGYKGKAMFVAIDKATAVRMYDLVQEKWQIYLQELTTELKTAPAARRQELTETIDYMQTTDMAVVVSQGQNEVSELKKKGLDIRPHRQRLLEEDLDKKFKDSENPLRLVFVCAMWMTGFDVPSCSTIYLDKPMRNHTLMQTIARANRVFGEKVNGLIVDYVGVFNNLQKALAIYGRGPQGGPGGESPIRDKAELLKELDVVMGQARQLLLSRDVDPDLIMQAEGFAKVSLLDDAVDALVASEVTKKEFMSLVNLVRRLYKAIMPDPVVRKYAAQVQLLNVLAQKIRALKGEVTIEQVMTAVNALLDDSVATEEYVIDQWLAQRKVDLSEVDFEALEEKFLKSKHKATAVESLLRQIRDRLVIMITLNRSRMNFQEKFEQMIAEYNAGTMNVEEFFRRLKGFANSLKDEEQRAVKENLTEEELAVYDLLTKPEPDLTAKEQLQVKTAAKDLLIRLKQEKIVLDWRKRQQTRSLVREAIEDVLDEELPEKYSRSLFSQKCDLLYQHIFEHYSGPGNNTYVA